MRNDRRAYTFFGCAQKEELRAGAQILEHGLI
jgi:hypothetical protein